MSAAPFIIPPGNHYVVVGGDAMGGNCPMVEFDQYGMEIYRRENRGPFVWETVLGVNSTLAAAQAAAKGRIGDEYGGACIAYLDFGLHGAATPVLEMHAALKELLYQVDKLNYATMRPMGLSWAMARAREIAGKFDRGET